jgi:hypothetical protein
VGEPLSLDVVPLKAYLDQRLEDNAKLYDERVTRFQNAIDSLDSP